MMESTINATPMQQMCQVLGRGEEFPEMAVADICRLREQVERPSSKMTSCIRRWH
jgi:hypothetical protein